MSTMPYTIADCEKEPLANSGLIQANGALLFLAKSDLTFRYVSENCGEFLGEAPDELLGADGGEWLELNIPDLVELPKGAGKRVHLMRGVDLGLGELDILISPTSSGWLLEFEFSRDAEQDPASFKLIDWQEPIDQVGLDTIQNSLVEQISAVTGYDRVMLYQFAPDWSGVVLAEKVTRSPGTYLSLRFPATDIPEIARKLYAQTPYRHIPDTVAEQVPILARQGEGTDLDLTWSDLRSVSPLHIEYLTNMNVGSSFSTSIMVEGKLWGLVACHNPESRLIPLEARQRCKELVEEYVEALLNYRHSVERSLLDSLTASLEPLRSGLQQGAALLDTLNDHCLALNSLLGASGCAVVVNDEPYSIGQETLSPEQLAALHQWCSKSMSDTVYATDNLSAAWVDAPGDLPVCGVLTVAVRARQLASGNIYLYFFRPEEVSEVAWAGNPEKPVEASGEKVKISPRKSFERWVQVRKGFSKNWLEDQLFIAGQMQQQLSSWL